MSGRCVVQLYRCPTHHRLAGFGEDLFNPSQRVFSSGICFDKVLRADAWGVDFTNGKQPGRGAPTEADAPG